MGRRRAKTESVKVEWSVCAEADPFVKDLVKAHHPHLAKARLVCLGKPKGPKAPRELVVVKVVTKQANALLKAVDPLSRQFDYALEVPLDVWTRMDRTQRTQVLDHALCHCAGQDDKGRWGLRVHDVEEFAAMLRRHGGYTAALREFIKEARQLSLELVGGA